MEFAGLNSIENVKLKIENGGANPHGFVLIRPHDRRYYDDSLSSFIRNPKDFILNCQLSIFNSQFIKNTAQTEQK